MYIPQLQQLNWIDKLKEDAAKAAAWTKKEAHIIATDVTLMGEKCGANPVCAELATDGT